MAIEITSLNNEAAAANTWREVAKDRSYSEWINTTTETTLVQNRITIRQQLIPKKGTLGTRRITIQSKRVEILDPTAPGGKEEILCQLTIVRPELLQETSETEQKDVLAFLRNFATANNYIFLARGEV